MHKWRQCKEYEQGTRTDAIFLILKIEILARCAARQLAHHDRQLSLENGYDNLTMLAATNEEPAGSEFIGETEWHSVVSHEGNQCRALLRVRCNSPRKESVLFFVTQCWGRTFLVSVFKKLPEGPLYKNREGDCIR